MRQFYTTGLKVIVSTKITKRRTLPILGEVLIKKGEKVKAKTIIAKTKLLGKIHPFNLVNILGIPPEDVRQYLYKKEGEKILKGEILAESKPLFKWFKTKVFSPIEGTIENISEITGQLLLRELPQELNLLAFIDGYVVEVIEKQGAVIETFATYIQGIFGLGKEVNAELVLGVETPDEELDEDKILPKYKGKIIIGGSKVTFAALKKIQELGIAGLIVGAVDAQEIKKILGYDLGVAITGTEEIGFTLILTEGFGKIAMANKTFELLKANENKRASINGATQIRAGVIRPEIIIPYEKLENISLLTLRKEMLKEKSLVRIIREPYFGYLGYVSALPVELQKIETETITRVVEIQLLDGEKITIPRANIEILEG